MTPKQGLSLTMQHHIDADSPVPVSIIRNSRNFQMLECEFCNVKVGLWVLTARAEIKGLLHKDAMFVSKVAFADRDSFVELNDLLPMHQVPDLSLK